MLRGQGSDMILLAVLSQFFAVALALEPLFAEIEGAYLGTMVVPPIEEMRRIFLARETKLAMDPDPTNLCSKLPVSLLPTLRPPSPPHNPPAILPIRSVE
jgi:hypothetical protein